MSLPKTGNPTDKEFWLIIAAFGAVYFLWGATYLFNYFAIQVIPPFLMSGSRFLTAGLLLFGFLHLRKVPLPSARQWFWSLILGILFLSLGSGGLIWALQFIDSGFAALIVAVDPLLIMLLLWVLQGVRPGWGSILGALLGFLGMYLLLGQPQLDKHPDAWMGLVAIAISLTAWAFATIFVSRLDQPANRFQRSAMQMISGGTVLVVFSLISGEASSFQLADLNWKAGLSWLYLVAFGSILAFSCFNYLLTKVSPEKVATSTYVNPLVALLLGWAFNNETITSGTLIAGGLMLTGVYFINAVKHKH
ncbi:MAG: EamA family transporter [Saprospiraceae bacterium]